MSVFTTFGTFSIVAGVLLIFLIFVMLSAERRTELGIARAVGTRREHVVQMFVFEGLAYDLGAAAVGAAFGVVDRVRDGLRAGGRLRLDRARDRARRLAEQPRDRVRARRAADLRRRRAVRVAREPAEHRRRRPRPARAAHGTIAAAAASAPASLGVVLGLALAWSGLQAGQATPFALGLSIAIISLVPLARAAGVPRAARLHRAPAPLLVGWWLLPFDTMSAIAGRELSMDFSAWVVSGLMLVAGSTWLIVYNADVLLGATMRVAGRIRPLAPVLKMAMAYPLRVRFRTGVTLAMFTLVVFTIVVGATTTRAFLGAMDDVEAYGGGFDVTRPGRARPARSATPAPAVRREVPSTFRIVASETVLSAKMAQEGDRRMVTYPLRGFDDSFLNATTYGLAARAKGYDSSREVWQALSRRPDLAVIDALAAPAAGQLGLRRRPRTAVARLLHRGRRVRSGARRRARSAHRQHAHAVTVIGVLADTVPIEKTGLWTSHRTALTIFGPRAVPTLHHLTGRRRASTRTRRRGSSSARSSRTAWRPSPCGARSTTPPAPRTRSTC